MENMRNRFRLLILAMLFCLCTAGRLSAIEPTTMAVIAGGLDVLSEVIAFLDSGADPSGLATFQNREMLVSIQERLSSQEKAIKTILTKLDGLPDTIRKETGQLFVEDHIDKVSGVIDDILVELQSYNGRLEKNPETSAQPLLRAEDLLGKLKEKVGPLLKKRNDDLIFPALLAAMYTETALTIMLAPVKGYTDQETQDQISAYEKRYHDRFLKMLEEWDENSDKRQEESLMWLIRDTEKGIGKEISKLTDLLSLDTMPDCLATVGESINRLHCPYDQQPHYTIRPDLEYETVFLNRCNPGPLLQRKNEINEILESLSNQEDLLNLYKLLYKKILQVTNSGLDARSVPWIVANRYETWSNAKLKLAKDELDHALAVDPTIVIHRRICRQLFQ